MREVDLPARPAPVGPRALPAVGRRAELAALDLMYAVLSGDLGRTRGCLDAGADPQRAWCPHGFTALQRAGILGRADIVSLLLTRGAPVDARDKPWDGSGKRLGVTALMVSVQHLAVVTTLLAHGADWRLRDVDGRDAASYALQWDAVPVRAFLLATMAGEMSTSNDICSLVGHTLNA